MLLNEEIIKSESWTLSRGKLQHLNGSFLIKQNQKKSAANLMETFEKEIKENRWLLQPIEQFEYMYEQVTIFNNFQGISLRTFLQHPISIATFFQIAEELVNTCILVHQQGLLLQRLNPITILIHPKTLQIKIVPTSSLSRWGIKAGTENDLYEMMFMAPEQMKMLHSEIDERVDLYALGAIFNTMLNGPMYNVETREQLLFQLMTHTYDSNSIEEKYGQPQLQAMINKLLAKNPNERYQTAYALKKDLQLLQQKKLKSLATADQLMKPTPTNKLVGRDRVITELEKMLQRATEGEKQFAILEGQSGIGKTSLVYTLQEAVLEKQGYFIECKFEELYEHQTMLFAEPFRQLCKQLYFKGKMAIEKFKQQVAIFELTTTKQLLQIVPELQLLVDDMSISYSEQEPVLQQHNYLLTSFQKLLSIFTALKEPIVISLDDCQWAYESTLHYFEHLYNHHLHGQLFIIATVRTGENENKVIFSPQTKPKYFELQHLSEEDVKVWLSHSIHLREDIAIPFAKQYFQFTNGNPFYMKKLFMDMLNSRALYFDLKHEIWNVNSSPFQEIFSDTTLTQFISNQTSYLSIELQKILQIASCIGQTFQAETVMHIAQCSAKQWQDYGQELIERGYIVSKSYQEQEVFQFIHGSIQETIYNQMNSIERQSLHYRIGKYYLENNEGISVRLVVKQLNLCVTFLNEEEKLQLVQWNNELGEKSASAGLYVEALNMYKFSLSILPQNHWELLHEQSLLIFKGIGECAFITGEKEFAEKHLYIAIKNATSTIEKLEIYLLMIFLYMEAEENERAIQVMHAAYKICQIDLPVKPTNKEVYREYLKLQFFLRRKKHVDLTTLKPIENKEIELLIKMNCALLGGSFRLEGNMTSVYLFRAMRLTLTYGIIEESTIIFINYALVVSVMISQVEQAKRFSAAAIQIGKGLKDIRLKSRVYFLYGVYHQFYGENTEETLHYLKESQSYANQFAVQSIFGSSSIILVTIHWHKSMSLKAMNELICFEQQKQETYAAITSIEYLQEMNEWIECLRDRKKKPIWEKLFTHTSHQAVIALHHVYRMQMSYLYGDEKAAHTIFEAMEIPLKQKINIVTMPYYSFYEGLWYFDFLNRKSSRAERKKYRKKIKHLIKRFKGYAKIMPQLYEHMYLLICAENHALKGEDAEAMLMYDHALQIAQIHKYSCELAVIYERASKFYERIGNEDKAAKYMQLAIENLMNWGAVAIAEIWGQRLDYSKVTYELGAQAYASYDLLAVLETSQSLAKEIKMDKLLEKLLFVLLKQANATSCYFLTVDGTNLQITASLQSANLEFQYLDTYTTTREDISAIAHFVLQCKEPVLLKNVQNSSLYSNIMTDVKSMLCAPIYYKGDIIAVVYLENALLYNAFNENQLQMIELIATQTAVSIENAKIYAELEERVALRTQQLEETNQHLIRVNEELEKKEKQRQKLFQSVSHELRSPLASILGFIEAILDGIVVPEKQQEYLVRSKERLFGMNRLIEDLFDLAKLEAGHSHFEFELVNAFEFVCACISNFQVEIQRANLHFETQCKIPSDTFIFADTARLKQVLNNILLNAIKYTGEGMITFNAYEIQGYLIIEIHDTGIGISEQDLPFIFDNFYKSVKTKGYDAHGLGLAICKQIIDSHEGNILVESKLNEGSIFKIELPIASNIL